MKPTLPSEEQLIKEIRETIKANPQFKKCINCAHFNKVTHECAKMKRRVLPYVPGCNFYVANEEMLLKETVKNLHEQARECEKIEFLLAMALTAANMTTLFIEDFERRVRAAYRREKAKEQTRREKALLKKDLDLAEQMDDAFKGIKTCMENVQSNYFGLLEQYVGKIEADLEKSESLYRHYIQSHVDKIFKKQGQYNTEASDCFHSDAGEFATLLLEFARAAHHNKENMEAIFSMLQSMENTNSEGLPITFCLDEKDIAHYRLKN